MSFSRAGAPFLTAASVFSDHMIIQHGIKLPVWGRTLPGAVVTLRFLAKTYRTTACGRGTWRIILDPVEPGGPYVMSIRGPEGAEDILIRDLYAGEVWLCSGQSNMELSMTRLKDDFPGEFEEKFYPVIRQYMLPYAWDFSGPAAEIPKAAWVQASAENLASFSGTAWFFAKNLQPFVSMPVGLIVAAVGGAPIEAFMSREALRGFPAKIARGSLYADPVYREKTIRGYAVPAGQWSREIRENDAGLGGEWFRPETPDASWDTITLPGAFSARDELKNFYGALWLRKDFFLSPSLADRELKLWLGTVVDADTAWINGGRVGETGYRYPPRKYTVPPELLREGVNQITLRVVCNGGEGGVTPDKPFSVFSGSDPFGPSSVPLGGLWKYKTGFRASVPRPGEFNIQWQPMGLFNGMISPLLELPVKGVLFYQGESNCGRDEDYAGLFLELIADWRRKKKDERLPFVFVQLPVFGEPGENHEKSSWALLREAQQRALSLPAVGMAAALDLGEWNDLHPANKKDLGLRLARAVMKTVYGTPGSSPGPLVKDILRKGGILVISFSNSGEGLVVREGGGEAGAFVTVLTGGGKTLRVSAKVESPDRLLVDLSDIEDPKKLLYAWADNPADRQLYNREGLPVIPFRLDIPPEKENL